MTGNNRNIIISLLSNKQFNDKENENIDEQKKIKLRLIKMNCT